MPENRIVLGTAKLGLEGRESAFGLLDAYVELGGTVIDTAAVYSDWVPGEPGRSETVLGEWMKARGNRHRITVTTKGAHPPVGDMHAHRSDPASIRHDVEQSLRRLGTDVIDLWSFHRDDESRPVAEMIGAIQLLCSEGKVRDYGFSNWSASRITEALDLKGQKPTANQPLGNILCRVMGAPGDDTLAVLDPAMLRQGIDNGLTLNLFTSQCGGYFERRKSGKPLPADYDKPACHEAASKIEVIAAREGLDVSHVIIAFMTGLAPNVRALVGPRNAAQLRGTYAAGDLVLDDAVRRELAVTADMEDFFLN